MNLINVVIFMCVLCSMVGFSMLAYRTSAQRRDLEPGEVIGLIITPPLGFAYQTGMLISFVKNKR